MATPTPSSDLRAAYIARSLVSIEAWGELPDGQLVTVVMENVREDRSESALALARSMLLAQHCTSIDTEVD